MEEKDIKYDADVGDFLMQEEGTKTLYVLKAKKECWKCRQKTTVIGFFFITKNILCTISNITKCPPDMVKKVQEKHPLWREGLSKAGGAYYANHCEKCGSIQGDYFLHNEIGRPFIGLDEKCLAQIIQHVPLEKYLFTGSLECTIGMGAGMNPQEWLKRFT